MSMYCRQPRCDHRAPSHHHRHRPTQLRGTRSSHWTYTPASRWSIWPYKTSWHFSIGRKWPSFTKRTTTYWNSENWLSCHKSNSMYNKPIHRLLPLSWKISSIEKFITSSLTCIQNSWRISWIWYGVCRKFNSIFTTGALYFINQPYQIFRLQKSFIRMN